jgi:hypothetical protein
MTENRTFRGILIVVALAALGAALVYVPPLVVQQYKTVEEIGGKTAVYIYFGIVGLGAALLLGSTIWILWSLLSASWRKQERRESRSRLPSEMTLGDREAEIQENLDLVERLENDENLSPEVRQELRPRAEMVMG